MKDKQNKKNALAAKKAEDEEMLAEEDSNSMQTSLEINETDMLTQGPGSLNNNKDNIFALLNCRKGIAEEKEQKNNL